MKDSIPTIFNAPPNMKPFSAPASISASIAPPRRAAQRHLRYRGMNFIEILFAVMILGIGFIMVAAIFPVAIQQSKANTDETTAARIAQSALATMRENTALMTDGAATLDVLRPITAASINNDLALFKRLLSQSISSIDPRYGCTFLYRILPTGDPSYGTTAQAIAVVTQSQHASNYTLADLQGAPFIPFTATAILGDSGTAAPDRIQFDGASPPAAAEGAFVIVAADFGTSTQRNGLILRLARQSTSDPTIWELQPNWDLRPADTTNPTEPVTVFIYGRHSNNTGTIFDGPNQAIAVYTSLIHFR